MYHDFSVNGNRHSKPDLSSYNTLLKDWAFAASRDGSNPCSKVEEIVHG